MPKYRTVIKRRVRRVLYSRPVRNVANAMRARLYRRPRFNPTPTFTETVKMSEILSNSTGVTAGLLNVALQYVPQYAQYTALYNQYCIRSVQFILMPAYDNYDSTNLTTNPASITAPRLVYAINDSAQQTVPTSEIDVLTDNGCKIRMLDRPVKIRCSPVAQVGMSASTGGFVSESKRNRWLSTTNPEIVHTGASFAISQSVQTSRTDEFVPPYATLYAKITFSLRDPK